MSLFMYITGPDTSENGPPTVYIIHYAVVLLGRDASCGDCTPRKWFLSAFQERLYWLEGLGTGGWGCSSGASQGGGGGTLSQQPTEFNTFYLFFEFVKSNIHVHANELL